jgi:hypothetical protein
MFSSKQIRKITNIPLRLRSSQTAQQLHFPCFPKLPAGRVVPHARTGRAPRSSDPAVPTAQSRPRRALQLLVPRRPQRAGASVTSCTVPGGHAAVMATAAAGEPAPADLVARAPALRR